MLGQLHHFQQKSETLTKQNEALESSVGELTEKVTVAEEKRDYLAQQLEALQNASEGESTLTQD